MEGNSIGPTIRSALHTYYNLSPQVVLSAPSADGNHEILKSNNNRYRMGFPLRLYSIEANIGTQGIYSTECTIGDRTLETVKLIRQEIGATDNCKKRYGV